jgi:hypothetical protein
MPLSVVSALARAGVDPWREAARLAGLPKATAAAALAGIIGKLSAGAELRIDAAACAGRLIELLPSVRPVAAAIVPAALRRRRPSLGLSELCLIVVLAVTGTTLAYQVWFSRAEPAATTVSPSAPTLR